MAVATSTYTPLQIYAGDADIRTKDVLVLANVAAIPAFTPLKRDANNKAIPATAIGDKIIGITLPKPDATYGDLGTLAISAVDTIQPVYTNGDFFANLINFAAITAATTDQAKDAVFDNTGINIKFVATGLL